MSPRRAAALAIVLCGAATWVFVKHIEFYAPLYAALALFYWRGAEYFRDRSRRNFAWLAASVFIAVSMHRVALFQVAAAFYVLRDPNAPRGWRGWRAPSRFEAGVVLGWVIAAALLHAVPVYLAAVEVTNIYVFENYNWLPELLTPFTRSWAEYVGENSKLGSFHLYTFGSLEHWKHFFFFMAVGAPAAWVVLVLKLRRPLIEIEKFLLIAAALGWTWALFWHPHLGYEDWDLFVNPAVPTVLLAAAVMLREEKSSG